MSLLLKYLKTFQIQVKRIFWKTTTLSVTTPLKSVGHLPKPNRSTHQNLKRVQNASARSPPTSTNILPVQFAVVVLATENKSELAMYRQQNQNHFLPLNLSTSIVSQILTLMSKVSAQQVLQMATYQISRRCRLLRRSQRRNIRFSSSVSWRIRRKLKGTRGNLKWGKMKRLKKDKYVRSVQNLFVWLEILLRKLENEQLSFDLVEDRLIFIKFMSTTWSLFPSIISKMQQIAIGNSQKWINDELSWKIEKISFQDLKLWPINAQIVFKPIIFTMNFRYVICFPGFPNHEICHSESTPIIISFC